MLTLSFISKANPCLALSEKRQLHVCYTIDHPNKETAYLSPVV